MANTAANQHNPPTTNHHGLARVPHVSATFKHCPVPSFLMNDCFSDCGPAVGVLLINARYCRLAASAPGLAASRLLPCDPPASAFCLLHSTSNCSGVKNS